MAAHVLAGEDVMALDAGPLGREVLLHGIPAITSIETNFVMSTVTETGPLPG